MRALLYQKTRKTTQSGQSGCVWVLESEGSGRVRVDPVTGWSGGGDRSVRLSFATRDEAIAYAERSGIFWREIGVSSSQKRRIIRSYADNFASSRRGSWTH